MKPIYVSACAVVTMVVSHSSWAQALPEAVSTNRDMVVTANPLATAAGVDILNRGGTAVDAMVAVQSVLGLVEPQSSGLGGGAFAVYYDASTNQTTTFDGREKAPATATETRFEGLGFFDAWQSGLSVGVPGTPKLMETMHRRYGRLPWRQLFGDATTLASNGFELTQRTSDQVAGLIGRNNSCEDRLFFRDDTAFNYFVNVSSSVDSETPDPIVDCAAKPAGTLVTNGEYASTLSALANYGANAFYSGDIASAIASAVQLDPNIPGDMTVSDLANYQVIERAPVCIDYRGYDVCGMGPPSSGAVAVGQILGILENFDLSSLKPLSVDTVHYFTQAGRLAFADRGMYLADSDFVSVPVEGLLNKTYLSTRAQLIGSNDMGRASPGTPPGASALWAADERNKDSGTSHISIVDRYGNALSMTTTIESSFGNGVMVHGFLLNNELTDFSFSPTDANDILIANRVGPNKRPRSSMSPTIVLDNGEPKLVTGSPGGSRIIGYTAQSIMNVIDFGLDPQQAINVPHFMNRNGSTDIETPVAGITQDYDADAMKAQLEAKGHTVNIRSQVSGLSVIEVTPTALIGGGDQRRDGTVGGHSTDNAQYPRILTTPDRVSMGNYGWALFADGTKQWIDSGCRQQLDDAQLITEVLPWSAIDAYPDGAVFSCDEVENMTNPGGGERPRLMVTPDKVDAGNYGWVLYSNNTKHWVDAECRSTLEVEGLETDVLEWVDINAYPDGDVVPCEDIVPTDMVSFPVILATPDRAGDGNYGWVLFEDQTKQWIDASCRSQLSDDGVDTRVIEWSEIDTYSDREPMPCGYLTVVN